MKSIIDIQHDTCCGSLLSCNALTNLWSLINRAVKTVVWNSEGMAGKDIDPRVKSALEVIKQNSGIVLSYSHQ